MDVGSDDDMVLLTSCSHSFHRDCLLRQVTAAWPGDRLSFNYLRCGHCRIQMETNDRALKPAITSHKKLEAAAMDALVLAKAEDDSVDDMAAFLCVRCSLPYCGGKIACGVESDEKGGGMCPTCAFEEARPKVASRDYRCFKHGAKAAVYKCDFCCAVATYDCSGTHFCDTCHGGKDFANKSGRRAGCQGRPEDKCPLSLVHPPNHPSKGIWKKSEHKHFVIGCLECLDVAEHSKNRVSRQTESAWVSEAKEQLVREVGLLHAVGGWGGGWRGGGEGASVEWTMMGVREVKEVRLLRFELDGGGTLRGYEPGPGGARVQVENVKLAEENGAVVARVREGGEFELVLGGGGGGGKKRSKLVFVALSAENAKDWVRALNKWQVGG